MGKAAPGLLGQRRRLFSSALGNDLPVDLFSIIIIPLNDQHDPVAGAECRVVIVEGIIAHDGHPIRQITKTPPPYFPAITPGVGIVPDGKIPLHRKDSERFL